jgi:mono/diheme cytochrome c family protein
MNPTMSQLRSPRSDRPGSTAGPPLRIRCLPVILLTFVLAFVPSMRAAEPGVSTPAGNARRGEQLFMAVGCYECHGTRGAGALNNGPPLAPNPTSWTAFLYQMRHPIGAPRYGNMKMPKYGPKVLSDAQIADLYAYLLSIKPGPSAASILLLGR